MNNHIFSLNCDYTNNIITISSVDDYSCKIVDSIINCFSNNNAKLYYASGLPDNIDEIYEGIKQFNPYYNTGDSKKFYIRRYPQICADLSDEKILSYLVNDWTSSDRNKNLALNYRKLLTEIRNTCDDNIDINTYFSITQGHDFLCCFQLYCNQNRIRKKSVNIETLIISLISSYHFSYFKETNLYNSLAYRKIFKEKI